MTTLYAVNVECPVCKKQIQATIIKLRQKDAGGKLEGECINCGMILDKDILYSRRN